MFLNLYKNSETVTRPRLVSVLTIVGHEPHPDKEGYIYVYMADGTRVSVPYSVEAFAQDVEMAARSFFQSFLSRGEMGGASGIQQVQPRLASMGDQPKSPTAPPNSGKAHKSTKPKQQSAAVPTPTGET